MFILYSFYNIIYTSKHGVFEKNSDVVNKNPHLSSANWRYDVFTFFVTFYGLQFSQNVITQIIILYGIRTLLNIMRFFFLHTHKNMIILKCNVLSSYQHRSVLVCHIYLDTNITVIYVEEYQFFF